MKWSVWPWQWCSYQAPPFHSVANAFQWNWRRRVSMFYVTRNWESLISLFFLMLFNEIALTISLTISLMKFSSMKFHWWKDEIDGWLGDARKIPFHSLANGFQEIGACSFSFKTISYKRKLENIAPQFHPLDRLDVISSMKLHRWNFWRARGWNFIENPS